MASYQRNLLKPENALKRAEELLALGSKHQALEALGTIALNKKAKQWSKRLEDLMLKFVSLCVELNKPVKAKDGLFVFRHLSLQQPQSLETVVKHFLSESERQADLLGSDVEDPLSKVTLDPSLVALIRSVSLEEYNRGTDDKAKPWLKLVYEAYRSALEILKNLPKLEGLYKDTAQKAFNYCVEFGRVVEFRRLADQLRNHLVKNTTQTFETEESLIFQLEIRFGQLTAAVDLELWQEAYKSIEDINNNLILVSKVPIPKELLLVYYNRLEKLFWVSNNYLLHAEALWKYTDLKIETDEETLASLEEALNSAETSEEKQEKSDAIELFKQNSNKEREVLYSRVLLAALSIPLNEKPEDPFTVLYDLQKEKESRLAQLLDFEPHPTRAVLLESISSSEIFHASSVVVQNIYNLFEGKPKVFAFIKEVVPALEVLDADASFKQYYGPLTDACFLKLLQHLSGVYQSLQLSQLQKMVPNLTQQQIEKKIVLAHKSTTVDCRLDSRAAVVHFNLSNWESEDFKEILVKVGRDLTKAVALVNPRPATEFIEHKKAVNQRIAANVRTERKKVLDRAIAINQVKALREERRNALAVAYENERVRIQEEEKAQLAAKKQKRLKENEDAEKARQQKLLQDQKKAILVENLTRYATATGTATAQKIATQIQSQSSQNFNQEDFVKAQLDKIVKERRRAEQAISAGDVRVDHTIRAQRELEKPILEAKYEASVVNEKKLFDEQIKLERSEAQKRVQQQQDIRNTIIPLIPDWIDFRGRLEKLAEEEQKEKAAQRASEVAKWREQKMKVLQEEQQKRNQKRTLEKKKQEEDRKREEEEEARREKERQEAYAASNPARQGGERPWKTGGGASESSTSERPWNRPGADSAAPSERPWKTGGGAAETSPPGDRPWNRPGAGAGGAGGAGGERPWSRPGAGAGGDAPAERPWNRPGAGAGAGAGGDAPAERPWNRTGTGAPATSGAGSRPWDNKPAGGDGPERPWKREGAGEEATGERPWKREGAGAPATSGAGSRPWDNKPAGGDGPERPWKREGAGEEVTSERPWKREGAGGPPATSGAGSRPWDNKPASSGPSGSPSVAGSRPWNREGGDSQEKPSGGRPWNREGDVQEKPSGGRPWNREGGDSQEKPSGGRPWNREGGDSQEKPSGGRPWNTGGDAGSSAGGPSWKKEGGAPAAGRPSESGPSRPWNNRNEGEGGQGAPSGAGGGSRPWNRGGDGPAGSGRGGPPAGAGRGGARRESTSAPDAEGFQKPKKR